MLIPIEPMILEQTAVAIHLMLVFAINTLERVSIEFSFFYFKSRRISFEIGLTAPHHLLVMFEFM